MNKTINKSHHPSETTDNRGGFHYRMLIRDTPSKYPKIVIGSRSSGKSFLLNKQIEESKDKFIIVRCKVYDK